MRSSNSGMRSTWLIPILALFLMTLAGCNGCDHDPFNIRVTTTDGQPLDSVLIAATGSNWSPMNPGPDYHIYFTGSDGWVQMDGDVYGRSGNLYHTDYLPRTVSLSPDAKYQLTATPLKANLVATLQGSEFFIRGNNIVSVTSSGDYSCYDMNGQLLKSKVGLVAGPLSQMACAGNHFWAISHDLDIVHLDLTDPVNPVIEGVYTIPEGCNIRAVSDSTLILTYSTHRDQYDFFIYRDAGLQMAEACTLNVSPHTVSDVMIVNKTAVFAFTNNSWMTVDISDPYHPVSSLTRIELNNIRLDDSLMIVQIGDGDDNFYNIYSFASGIASLRETIRTYWNLAKFSDADHVLLTTNGGFNRVGYILAERSPGTSEFIHKGFVQGYGWLSATRYPFVIAGTSLYRWQ